MMDEFLVYIDVLAVNGAEKLPMIIDRYQLSITTERPDMIYQQMWDIVRRDEGLPNGWLAVRVGVHVSRQTNRNMRAHSERVRL